MASIAELKELRKKHREQDRILREAEKRAGLSTARERDAERKRQERADGRIVVIPRCKDRDRRDELEADDIRWLMYYFGEGCGLIDTFWYEFTSQQREMIEAFGAAIEFGGDQSVAASRGEGKTTILERLITKYTLQGTLGYSVLFQATATLAENSLDAIKTGIEENERLAEDYPEVCFPIRALRAAHQRAQYQVASGFRHDNDEPFEMAHVRFTWCAGEAIFPRVPGAPASGAIINTRGLDGAVRGLKKRGRRPQLAAIDDPDTETTARNSEQAEKLETRIDRAIGGLGGQKRPIARIMLCTIPSRTAVAYKFTDVNKKPSWKGKRFRYLITPPDRMDLWDEYVRIRGEEFRAAAAGKSDDEHCRGSHRFFLERRADMESGAVVANPNRFNGELLPDGTRVEESALQHYFNEVARLGPDAVATEYDNDPPEESSLADSGITASRIQSRLSGYERGVVPPECSVLTQGIDVQKAGLHWVVKAWRPDATNYVIDYGFFETFGTQYASDEGVELAVHRAILGRMEQAKATVYAKNGGDPMPIGVTLVDSGWQASTIYQACREVGLGIYPAKGHGKSHGCATPNFHEILRYTPDRRPGDGYFLAAQPSGVWLVHCDTDRWKSFEHARWMTPDGRPGAAYIFGDMTDEERRHLDKRQPRDSKDHFSFARHLTAEIESEELVRGVLKRLWKIKPGRVQNHYLDASYLADVGAALLDVKLLPPAVAVEAPKKPAVISAGKPAQQRW